MENISKNVLLLNEGVIFGFVLDVVLDESGLKKIGYYVVENESESEFLLLNDDILSCGEVFIVRDISNLQFVGERPKSLVSRFVYDENGNFYGSVRDVVFQRNILSKLITEKCEICRRNILSVERDFVIVKTKRKVRKHKNEIRPFKIEKKLERRVFIQKSYSVSNIPQKVNLSPSYYIGKTSKSDVFGYNNERVVVSGEKITKTIFENVKKHNKLNELFFVINN